ncbi:TraR/DksA C4-type zinc finger protein [Buttiauxella ferragutiae]|uniref:TraR/DksA C4-type zinc finger protein n=1 Tax=Buttiauxella ferragutiae TaxID=82989 RepID=UPI003525EA8B
MPDLADEASLLTEQMLEVHVMAIRQTLQAPTVVVKNCEACGHPIGDARRKIMPAAALCVDCQFLNESLKKHYLR